MGRKVLSVSGGGGIRVKGGLIRVAEVWAQWRFFYSRDGASECVFVSCSGDDDVPSAEGGTGGGEASSSEIGTTRVSRTFSSPKGPLPRGVRVSRAMIRDMLPNTR